MRDWRTDPTFTMCRALVDGADLASFAGGAFDVRAVVAGIQSGTHSGLLLDAVPCGNFPDGDDVREAVQLLHTGDNPAHHATDVLGGLCANDSRAAAALAVPFLIPIATDAHHSHRAAALAVLSGPARPAPGTSASPPAMNSFSTAPILGATPPTTTTTTASR
ncbi:hypothetical protein ACWEO4_40285 [Streptomyces sp. NPDC004393]